MEIRSYEILRKSMELHGGTAHNRRNTDARSFDKAKVKLSFGKIVVLAPLFLPPVGMCPSPQEMSLFVAPPGTSF
jgi:hypothetical protein